MRNLYIKDTEVFLASLGKVLHACNPGIERKAEGHEFKVILLHYTASARPSERPGTLSQVNNCLLGLTRLHRRIEVSPFSPG